MGDFGEVWRRTVTDDWAVPRTADADVVVIETLDDHRTLIALDAATGAERWRKNVKGAYSGISLDSAGGVLVLGDGSNRVIAIDTATGRERWSRPIGGAYANRVRIADGVVAWVSAEGAGCFDLADGAVRWSGAHQPIDGFYVDYGEFVDAADGVVVHSGRYYDRPYYDREPMPAMLSHTSAVDMATGDVLWTRDFTPLGPGVFTVPKQGIEAVDYRTGQRRWRAGAKLDFSSYPLIAAGNVVTPTADGVAAFDAATGVPAWKLYEPPPVHYWETSPAGADHVLLALVNGHRRDVRLLNGSDGAVRARVPVPAMCSFAGNGGALFVQVEHHTVAGYQNMKD